MALTGNEQLSPGHGLVIDKTTGAVVVVTTGGVRRQNGWLVDADGRLVVVSA